MSTRSRDARYIDFKMNDVMWLLNDLQQQRDEAVAAKNKAHEQQLHTTSAIRHGQILGLETAISAIRTLINKGE